MLHICSYLSSVSFYPCRFIVLLFLSAHIIYPPFFRLSKKGATFIEQARQR